MIETLIKSITEIANHEKVKEHLEPSIMEHLEIKEWMVKRVLYAYCLLMEHNDDKTMP